MTVDLAPALLSGYLLALVRAAAWVFVCPPFGNRSVPTTVKVGLAAALALVAGPHLVDQAVPLEVGPMLSAAALQVAAGLALGFLGVLLFSTFTFAGGLIDLVSGYSVAQLFDPGNNAPVSIFGQFYGVLATTLLFAIDGHLLLVRGFLTSFTAAPLTHLSTDTLAKLLTGDIALFFVSALEIAAPLLAALFLAEAALGLLSRAAPQMNIFQLGLPVKILVTLTLAGLALPLLPDAVSGMANHVVRQSLDLIRGMSSDKTEQPTAKKKREARRDGNLARSGEVVAWAQMLAAGVLLPASFSLGTKSLRQVMTQVGVAVSRPDTDSALRLLGAALKGGLLALAPLALGMVAIGLIGNFAQTGFAISGKALRPKFDRISPKKGLKRMLSPHSAWEAAKAAVKLLVLTAVAWPGVAHLGTALATGGRVPSGQVMAEVAASTMGLIRSTALAGLALAALDYGFQRRRVRKGMMMTKQEVKEEYRQSEGDPMTRQRIRQRQMEMSRNRMMAAVAVSSVVVVNPTHYAVALEYRPELGAPRVVAKGQGHIAARIREEAEKHNVPIVRDVPLARTLHAACKLGQAIPADLYEAVARLLAFVFSLKRTVA